MTTLRQVLGFGYGPTETLLLWAIRNGRARELVARLNRSMTRSTLTDIVEAHPIRLEAEALKPSDLTLAVFRAFDSLHDLVTFAQAHGIDYRHNLNEHTWCWHIDNILCEAYSGVGIGTFLTLAYCHRNQAPRTKIKDLGEVIQAMGGTLPQINAPATPAGLGVQPKLAKALWHAFTTQRSLVAFLKENMGWTDVTETPLWETVTTAAAADCGLSIR